MRIKNHDNVIRSQNTNGEDIHEKKTVRCKEYKDYIFLLNGIENDVLRKRAEISLNYYLTKAALYKNTWNILSVAGIFFPAVATFVASFNTEKSNIIVMLITALTSIFSGCLALFKCADKKTSYRNSAENLKCELCAYVSQNGIYAEDPSKNDELFFNRLESIIKEGYEKIKALENEKASSESK